jgi:hypothetical protein
MPGLDIIKERILNMKEQKSNIRHFNTGAVRGDNAEKEDYVETISWTGMKRYAIYMTGKQSKYGRGNWRKGIPIGSYEESLMRHVQKYLANKYENAGSEPEEDHLAAIIFNTLGIMNEEEKMKKKN